MLALYLSIGKSFFAAINSSFDKVIQRYDVTGKTYAFYNDVALVILLLPILFLNNQYINFSFSWFILFIIIVLLRVGTSWLKMNVLKTATPIQENAIMSIGVFITYGIGVCLGDVEFRWIFALALGLMVVGIFILVDRKIDKNVFNRYMFSKLFLEVLFTYSVNFILKDMPILLLIWLRAVAVSLITIKGAKYEKSSAKGVGLIVFGQIFGIITIYLSFYASMLNPTLSYYGNSTKIIFILLLSYVFKTENTKPNARIYASATLIAISVILIGML